MSSDLKFKFFGMVVLFFVCFGWLFPALISAKSTLLVLFGIAGIVGYCYTAYTLISQYLKGELK